MKKVSAFSVFRSRKEKGDTPKVSNEEEKGNIRRASSTPMIKTDDGKSAKGKKLLKVLKGGSLRQSMRGTPKSRPSILKMVEDQAVAGDSDSVTLTSVKSNPDLLTVTSTSSMVTRKRSPKTTVLVSATNDTPSLPKVPINKPVRIGLPPKSQKPTNAGSQNSLNIMKTSPKSKSSPNLGVAALQIARPLSSEKSGKRQREDGDTEPSKKKKTGKEDKSMEDIEQVMSFTDENNTGVWDHNLPYMFNSTEEAKKIFECLIHPIKPDKFFKELWERKPLLVRRHLENYNDGWFSTAELDKILRQENIHFGVNLDVTTFTDGKRETHNPAGRAHAPVVWDFYQNGCSVRMLNPQTYSRNVWKLLSVLQEYFGCCCGANVYLTPPGTQGFAPHYDDIEAFILQLEGKKYWRLYSPRSDAETLPRLSSGNFSEDDIGEPILDVVLEPGDLLYFPRGVIHQGKALEDTHSLHITVSCYQKNTWGDLLEKLMPRALQVAIEEDVDFRKGLPRDYMDVMGIANSDIDNPQRKVFLRKIQQLMTKLISYAPVDSACDQLSKHYIHDSLPPVLSEAEKSCSVHGDGERWEKSKKCVVGTAEMEPDTQIKIIRKGVLRLLTEDDDVRIYHSLDNTRIYHGSDPQYIEISAEAGPAVEYLIHSYPEYVAIDSLPLGTLDEKIAIASVLYDHGLLLTSEPLGPIDDDESSGEPDNC
ncbi:ribosomal oxygenase 1-like isoform X2 [Mytilus californianus]|uniref:ribosomal oxygenase 1-like isoform X1 n=1 Tax=Mytilus californianus TaxID=6549 RepID=UPI0022471DE8|nr:ribosomal oxygenase 1-like isoform X1 [Mytilus californianus]XP_052104475.1 ribosomal oxygenase 1-like isoform X2 [Mytilus californianus]